MNRVFIGEKIVMYEIFDNIEDNREIATYYQALSNYKIEEFSGGYCWVFFTSHGLYFPTEYSEFEKQVVQNDKYEWINVSKDRDIRKKAAKFIFVRDIYKNWCLEGINSTVNSIEKLAELIRNEAEGNEIITVGSSAGGYMAIALGCLLNAKYIYSFSPQISLVEYEKYHPIKYFSKYRSDMKNRWLSLDDMISNYRSGEIFYYYPTQCAEDVAQYNVLKRIKNDKVHVFAVRFSKHGTPIYGESVKRTLCIAPENLIVLCKKYGNREITRIRYLIDTSGIVKAGLVVSGSLVKRIVKRLRKKGQ